MLLSLFSPLGELLYFACPKQSNQIKGHPTAACILRYSQKREAAELELCPQTVLAENSRFSCVARRDKGELKSKPI